MAISRQVRTPEQSASNDETYTPPWLFEALEIEFDLDVASPVEPLPWHLPAQHRYTINDDALQQPWFGKVWMNPPYSKPTPWVERFIEHNNGVALLPMTRARWFINLWHSEATFVLPINPTNTMFQFVTRQGKPKGIFMPVVLVALGAECQQAVQRIGPAR
jgi:hypothetical protein